MKRTLQKLNQSNLFFDQLIVLAIFILGLSLANYLGIHTNPRGFIFGWVSCALLLLSLKIMEFYNLSSNQLDIDHQFLQHLFPGLSIDRDRRKNKAVYAGLILILICLGGWAIIQFVLLQMGDLPAGALIWLGLIVLDVLLLSVPAIRLSNSGYAELMQAMLLFGLIPIYAYQALTGEYHVLMVLICLPLTFFYLATRLVHALFHYTEDQQSGRLNFLQLTGWKQGMTIHNLFVLLGYLTYACIPLFRFPTHIFLSPLITLPVGLILIGLMFRIERGKKPVWNSFLLLEKGLMFLVIYFLTAALILR